MFAYPLSAVNILVPGSSGTGRYQGVPVAERRENGPHRCTAFPALSASGQFHVVLRMALGKRGRLNDLQIATGAVYLLCLESLRYRIWGDSDRGYPGYEIKALRTADEAIVLSMQCIAKGAHKFLWNSRNKARLTPRTTIYGNRIGTP